MPAREITSDFEFRRKQFSRGPLARQYLGMLPNLRLWYVIHTTSTIKVRMQQYRHCAWIKYVDMYISIYEEILLCHKYDHHHTTMRGCTHEKKNVYRKIEWDHIRMISNKRCKLIRREFSMEGMKECLSHGRIKWAKFYAIFRAKHSKAKIHDKLLSRGMC